MAQGQYEKLYKTLKSSGVLKSNTSKASSSERLQSQIDNYEKRLKSVGVDTSKTADDRNAVEKLFNLDKNQGLLGDIFEVLGRPQQAIFGGIENAQNGEDFLEGVKEGFTGEKDTQFKKILTNAGMSDRKGKLDLSDVLGFAGDVFLDPIDLVPVAGFSKFDDALKAGDKFKDAAKNLRSTSDLLMEGAIKGVKGGAKLADKGIEKALEKADNLSGITYKATNTNQIANLGKELSQEGAEKIAKKYGKKVDDITKDAVTGKLEIYKDIKDTISKNFNFNRNISKDVARGINENNVNQVLSANELKGIKNNIDNALNEYAKVVSKNGDNIDNIINQANKDVLFLKENANMYENGKKTEDALKVINNGIKGRLMDGALGKRELNKLEKIAKDVNDADLGYKLSIKSKNGVLEFDNWDKALEQGRLDMDEIANTTIDLKSTLDAKQKKRLKDLKIKLDEDKDFKKLYDSLDDAYDKSNSILNKRFDVNINGKGNNASYIRHGVNEDNLEAFKDLMGKYSGDATGSATSTIGNTKTLKSRELLGSVEEVNNYYAKQLKNSMDKFSAEEKVIANKIIKEGVFKNGYTDAFSDYLENVPKTVKNAKNFDTVMTKAALGDYDKINSLEKTIDAAEKAGNKDALKELYKQRAELLDNTSIKILTKNDDKIPRGYIKLSGEQVHDLAVKSDTLAKQLGVDNFDQFSEFIRKNGDNVAINSELYRLIDISSNKAETKGLVRLYDKYLSTFKKYKVLSPTFQMNNIVGNMSNMYLAGISATDQARLYPRAIEILKKGADPDVLERFNKAGFGDVGKMTALELRDMPDSLKAYFTGEKTIKDMSKKEILTDLLPYFNNKMNQEFDTFSRMVVFLKGEESPNFLKRLNVEDAGEAVRKVLFDPNELTTFEQETMKRLVPFYTFTKKNLAFQIDNLSKNGGQYTRLMKGYNSLLKDATDGNTENVSDWLKNNMYIPIPSMGEDGSYRVLRVQMPFGNLIDTIDDPLGAGVSLVSPLARVPIELKTGVNTYTGRDIEKYPGQKSTTIPFLTKKQEYLLGNLTGLDAPLKTGSRVYEGIQDTMNSNKSIGEQLINGGANMVTLNQSIDNDKLTQMYDRLEKLEDLVNKYKNETGDLPTIRELEAANTNNKVSNIIKTVNKLNGVKSNPYKQLNKNAGVK